MPEEPEGQSLPASEGNVLRNVLLGVAIVYVIASLYFIFDLRGRLDKLETTQKSAAAENAQLLKRLGITETSLKSAAQAQEVLADKVGMTQKEISARAAQLARQQKEAEQRLSAETNKVSGEVAGVKTDLGGTKNDLAATKSDLETTKGKLERAIGDLGVQSGLIAHTRDDLEVLKHRGDRNVYEFTLQKGARPQPVSTVSLQLRKVDPKRSKFTLNVLSDDRIIEKKDRTLFEPLQFLSGREHNLYEIVVLTADKKRITGYLTTPKSAPLPTVQK